MARPLDGFDQRPDAVEVEVRAERAHVEGHDPERLARSGAPTLEEADTEVLVHDFFEAPPGPPRLGTQLRSDIVIQRQRRAHILMLM